MTELQISTSVGPWTPAATRKNKSRIANLRRLWRDDA